MVTATKNATASSITCFRTFSPPFNFYYHDKIHDNTDYYQYVYINMSIFENYFKLLKIR
ncbi:hypothetical protein GCM10025861_08390 [Methanobacterium petrolearium]|nr:hypothetical protein GCM10025861_08390 [Methanobacterium petrolearium]